MKTIYIRLLLVLINTAVVAQKEIKSYPLSKKITIDGELSETVWKNHLQFGNFKQLEPNNGKNASQKTRIAITNDDTYMYVAAEIWSNNISKSLTARDNSKIATGITKAIAIKNFEKKVIMVDSHISLLDDWFSNSFET